MTTVDLEQVAMEARRVYLRYAVEVVEAFSFCPWAKAAREAGQVHIEVVPEVEPGIEQVVAVVESVGGRDTAEIGIVLFPRLTLDLVPFQRFVAQVRVAYGQREHDGRGFAMAEFHPHAPPDISSPGKTLGFIRRSPDPTIQLVRLSALASVRKVEDQGTSYVDPAALLAAGVVPGRDRAPLNQRVAAANRETIRRAGPDAVDAVMRDIRDDRDRSYRALGVPLPPWAQSGRSLAG